MNYHYSLFYHFLFNHADHLKKGTNWNLSINKQLFQFYPGVCMLASELLLIHVLKYQVSLFVCCLNISPWKALTIFLMYFLVLLFTD